MVNTTGHNPLFFGGNKKNVCGCWLLVVGGLAAIHYFLAGSGAHSFTIFWFPMTHFFYNLAVGRYITNHRMTQGIMNPTNYQFLPDIMQSTIFWREQKECVWLLIVGCWWSGRNPLFFGGFWGALIHNFLVSDDALLLQLGSWQIHHKSQNDTRNHESNILSVPTWYHLKWILFLVRMQPL